MALMSPLSWQEWIDEYAQSHQHPTNRLCHTFGIPSVVAACALAPVALVVPGLRWPVGALFVAGWSLQFIGHAYEGKPPEFLKDGRFLFVGMRWWVRKITGHEPQVSECSSGSAPGTARRG